MYFLLDYITVCEKLKKAVSLDLGFDNKNFVNEEEVPENEILKKKLDELNQTWNKQNNAKQNLNSLAFAKSGILQEMNCFVFFSVFVTTKITTK